ncbi:hypothetical protein Dimus_015201 [Dionaea muscipula]
MGLVWAMPRTLDGVLSWWRGVKFKKKDLVAKTLYMDQSSRLPALICWFIWKKRNEIAWEGKEIGWGRWDEQVKGLCGNFVKLSLGQKCPASVNELVFNLEAVRGK